MTIKDWQKMYKKEKAEHKSLPSWAVKQIVKDHMAIHKKMKGTIMDWIAALSGLAIVSILWITFSSKLIYPQLLPMAGEITDPNGVQTVQLFTMVWAYWPVIMVVGFILLVLVASQSGRQQY